MILRDLNNERVNFGRSEYVHYVRYSLVGDCSDDVLWCKMMTEDDPVGLKL